MNKTKVLIADDHAVVRTGLAALLGAKPELEVVGTAENGAKALERAAQLKPDLVIMDLLMPVMNGIEASKELRKLLPDVKILVLTTSTEPEDLSRALSFGVNGAITKSAPNKELLQAIREIRDGKTYVAREVADLIAQSLPKPELTERQQQALEYLVRGLTNDEIARLFGVATITVRKHLRIVFEKIGAGSRTEAVAIALKKRLVKG